MGLCRGGQGQLQSKKSRSQRKLHGSLSIASICLFNQTFILTHRVLD